MEKLPNAADWVAGVSAEAAARGGVRAAALHLVQFGAPATLVLLLGNAGSLLGPVFLRELGLVSLNAIALWLSFTYFTSKALGALSNSAVSLPAPTPLPTHSITITVGSHL